MRNIAPAADQVLIVQSRDDFCIHAANRLESELAGSFNLVKLKKLRDTNEIAGILRNFGPRVIVIFEKHAKTSSLYWFREYLRSHASEFSGTAFVFVKDYFAGLSDIYMDNATGISFLPPVILGVEKLQEKVHKEIRSVGVIHPRAIRKMIVENGASCMVKGVSLIMKPVPDRNAPLFPNAINEALNNMKKQKVDVLWIVEDESLLQLQLVRDIWGPFLKKSGIPTIVNNDALLTAPWEIGTVSIVPDPEQLSGQVAEKVRELKRDNWIVYNPSIEPLDSYSEYLKKIPISKGVVASVQHDRQNEVVASAAFRQDTVPPAEPPLPHSPLADPDTKNTAVPPPALLSATDTKETVVTQVMKDISSRKTAANRLDYPSPKAEKTAKREKSPKSENSSTAAQSNSHQGHNEETVRQLPSDSILEYVLVTAKHTSVTQWSDTASSIIGWALNGQQFPVFDKKGDKLWIAFFNTYGWIAAKDVKAIEETDPSPSEQVSPEARNYLIPVSLIALCAVIVVLLIALIKNLTSRPAQQAFQKECILLARKGRQAGSGLRIKDILTRIGFTVHSSAELKHVNKWIHNERLDFIFIDWYLDADIEEKIAGLVRGISRETAVRIVFYDVAEKMRTTGSRSIGNSILLGSECTAHDIHRIVAPQALVNGSDSDGVLTGNTGGNG